MLIFFCCASLKAEAQSAPTADCLSYKACECVNPPLKGFYKSSIKILNARHYIGGFSETVIYNVSQKLNIVL